MSKTISSYEIYKSIRKGMPKPSKVIHPKKSSYDRKWDWRDEIKEE